MATTFSLVVIFVPVAFMSSISGRFLYQFGITAAVAVLVSLLVSFTLTPMMSARMLRPEDAAAGGDDAHSRQGFLRLARSPLRAHARLVDGPSRRRDVARRGGDPLVDPALQDGPPGIYSHQRRRSRVRRQRHRAGRHQPRVHRQDHADGRKRDPRCADGAPAAVRRRRRASLAA